VILGRRTILQGLIGVVLLSGCRQVGDHERRGDQAYGEGRYTEALTEYRAAVAQDPDARLWAKTGAAALRTGNLEVAADAYLRLAAEDPTRAEEAAEGLRLPDMR
jgi:tetratricopeptide (TPR) repeat protein